MTTLLSSRPVEGAAGQVGKELLGRLDEGAGPEEGEVLRQARGVQDEDIRKGVFIWRIRVYSLADIL